MTATLTFHKHCNIFPTSKRNVAPNTALLVLLKAGRITFAEYATYKQSVYSTPMVMLKAVAELKQHSDVVYIINNNMRSRRICHFARHDITILIQDAYQYLIPSGRINDVVKNCSSQFRDAVGNAMYSSRLQTDIAEDLVSATMELPPNPMTDSFFHIRKNGDISYLPKGKLLKLTDSNKWCPSNRITSKTGKAIRKFFLSNNFSLPDEIISDVAEKVDSQYKFSATIKLVEGEELRHYYNGTTYASGCGSLNNSCMRHERCQSYYDIFVENPDKVKLLVAINKAEQLIGRALLWFTDSGHAVLDRIYGTPLTIHSMTAYAHECGWLTKSHQSYDYPRQWKMANGEVFECTYSVTFPKTYDEYPYMDTFKALFYLSDNSVTLKNTDYDGDLRLTDTDGNSRNMVNTYCGEYCDEDDARWSDYYDDYVYYDNAVYSDVHSTYITYNDGVDCYHDGYVHTDEVIQVRRPNRDSTANAWQDADEITYCHESGTYYDSRRGIIVKRIDGSLCYKSELRLFTHYDVEYIYDFMTFVDGTNEHTFYSRDVWVDANHGEDEFHNLEINAPISNNAIFKDTLCEDS